VVLVAGEAGIGKTSLAQEISRAAAWLGTPAVWGPAIEGEGTPPYWAWRQALGALGRLPGSQAPPDFARLDTEVSPFVFFEAVVATLLRAADPDGLVVVLDDLHWADSGSLRLLQVAAAQVPASRVLIVGTYREPEPGVDSPLAQVLPSLLRERGVSRVRLAGLDAGETESLLSQMLAEPPPPGLVDRLLGQTDGNPFYLVELAETMGVGGGRAPLPRTLHEIARRRLALVGESCRRTLGAASVIGRGFELDLLAAAAAAAPAEVLEQLAEAGAAGLVEEVGPGRYQFAHALLREALYQDLRPADRSTAHARVAGAIQALEPAARRARIDTLAHHLRHALPLGDAAEALAATVEAAEADEAALAFEQAAAGYAEALTLTAHARSRLLLRQAHCHQRAGDAGAAWEASRLAAAAARAENDVRALAEAALVLPGGLVDANVAGPLLTLCEEALRALAGADAVLEARLLAQASIAASASGAESSQAGRALQAARGVGDPDAHFRALQAREREITGAPDLAQTRLELSEEAVGVAEASPDPALAVWAHSWRLGASWELGLRRQADVELAALADAVERLKEPLARWRLEVARGSLALIDGRYDDAVEAGERGFAIAHRGGHPGAAQLATILQRLAAVRTGEPLPEEELSRQLAIPGGRFWYAAYLADQGRVAELRQIWPGGSAAVPRMSREMWLIANAGKARIAVALEDGEWAREVYEQLSPYPELHVVRGPLGGYEGPIALHCGRLAALLGRLEDAERFLEQALLGAQRIGSPPFEAIARRDQARVLRRRGRPRDLARAITLLEQAQATAQRLGMRPLAEMAASELDTLRHPRGRRTLLSNRELEVAGLVGDGLTNRAIGERLHISERTAENHVKNILDKLGLDSRAQIAAWSASQAAKLST